MPQERLTNKETSSHCAGIFRLSDGREIEVQGRGGRGWFTFTDDRGKLVGQGAGIIFKPSSEEIVPSATYFRLASEVEGLRFQSNGPTLLDVYVIDGPNYCERILSSKS